MNDSKKPQREHNPDEDQQPVPFDDALRRLVNTPPKHRKATERAKPKRGKETKCTDS